MLLPRTASIDRTGARPGTVTALLVSSRAIGVSATPTLLDPQRQFATDSLAPRLLALLVNPVNQSAYEIYQRWGWRKVAQLRPAWPDAPLFNVLILPLPVG